MFMGNQDKSAAPGPLRCVLAQAEKIKKFPANLSSPVSYHVVK